MQCLKNVSAASLSLRKLLEDMLKMRDETKKKKRCGYRKRSCNTDSQTIDGKDESQDYSSTQA